MFYILLCEVLLEISFRSACTSFCSVIYHSLSVVQLCIIFCCNFCAIFFITYSNFVNISCTYDNFLPFSFFLKTNALNPTINLFSFCLVGRFPLSCPRCPLNISSMNNLHQPIRVIKEFGLDVLYPVSIIFTAVWPNRVFLCCSFDNIIKGASVVIRMLTFISYLRGLCGCTYAQRYLITQGPVWLHSCSDISRLLGACVVTLLLSYILSFRACVFIRMLSNVWSVKSLCVHTHSRLYLISQGPYVVMCMLSYIVFLRGLCGYMTTQLYLISQ